jgi:hypothetical protein
VFFRSWLRGPQLERDVQADLLVDEILEISDDGSGDDKLRADGVMVVDHVSEESPAC